MMTWRSEQNTTVMHISVAMCTFNGARYLDEQLRSIRAQTLPPDELVVCDDGSRDQTRDLIEAFAREVPFPVRFILNEQKLGPAKNFEKAMRLCRGELIALSDQDDAWAPVKLAHLAGILDANTDLDGLFSDAGLIDENSLPLKARLWERVQYRPSSGCLHVENSLPVSLLKLNVVTGATLMIRASAREFLLPVPEVWMHDGWIAWMLVLHSRIGAVDEPLMSYRIHSAQHAGISRGTLRARIEVARQTGRKECLPTARQFEALCAYMIEHPGCGSETLLADVQKKIDHLHCRLDLPGNLLTRTWRIAASCRDYCRYGNGPATMLKDLLVP